MKEELFASVCAPRECGDGLPRRNLRGWRTFPQPGAQMWETGRMTFPRADTLAKIAEILEVDLRWLITGEGSPDASSAERLDQFPLETMMQAIANKGFDVTVVARGLPTEDAADPPDGDGTN